MNVSRGRLKMPHRYLIIGVEGVGKSTLAANAPNPIFLDIEDGTSHMDVARFQFRDGEDGHVPGSYSQVLNAIGTLVSTEHDFKTLVIDTTDRLEALIWQHIINRDSTATKKLKGIDDYGYGKGFQVALDEWRMLTHALDRLRTTKRMSIVLLCHAQIKAFKSPTSDSYDRYTVRLNEKAGGFLKEWADVVGFACFEEGATESADGRIRGIATGRRLLKLQREAAFDAKSRLALPKEIELEIANPWAPIAAAVDAGENVTPESIVAQITAELERINDADLKPKVEGAVKEAGKDTAALSRYLNSLKERKVYANVQQ